MLLKQWAKEKQKLIPRKITYIPRKIAEEKQKNVTIMISIDGKRTLFPVKLKLEWESFE